VREKESKIGKNNWQCQLISPTIRKKKKKKAYQNGRLPKFRILRWMMMIIIIIIKWGALFYRHHHGLLQFTIV